MAVVTTLSVNMVAKTSSFDKGMKRSQKNMRGFQSTAKKAAAAMKGMFAGLIAFVGVRALTGFAKSMMAAIDATAKLSDRIGIATEDIIGLRHAAEITGVASESLDKSLEMLVRRLGEVRQGTGEAKRALEELGLDVNKLIKLSPAMAFKQIADEINKMSNQADKAAAAYQLFGRQGVKLLNTLKLGSAGLEEMQAETEKLGKTFTGIDADKIEAANDAITRMKSAFKGLGQKIVIGLAEPMEKAADAMTEFIRLSRERKRVLQEITGTAPTEIFKGTDIEIMQESIKGFKKEMDDLNSLGGLNSPLFRIKEQTKLVTVFLKDAEAQLVKFQKTADNLARSEANAALFGEAIVKVKKFNESLKDQVRLFGATAPEKAIDRLRKLGETLTGIEKLNFDRFIAQSGRLTDKLFKLGETANKVKKVADNLARMRNIARDLVDSLKGPQQRLEDYNELLEKLVKRGLLTVPQQLDLIRKKRDELFDTSKIKSFADSIKQSLKTPLELLKDFRKQLKEAEGERFLSSRQFEKALRNKAKELLPSPAARTPTESREIRTAFVNVAALSAIGQDPQVKEQQKTNEELVKQTQLLKSIADDNIR